MAPRRPAGPSNENPDNLAEDLAVANAEIERLRALLESQETPTSETETPSPDGLVSVLHALSQRLSRVDDAPAIPTKSAKIPDPPILTDGKDPTFESWKLQIQGKLRVNADHFPTNEARMAYVFSQTGGDAQGHLRPRYDEDSEDLFLTDQEMISHLTSIYEDPHKVQNARIDYKSLFMKPSETFVDFHTHFLHLAGQAKIPKDDLCPDLFDKLTLELQRTVLPVYSTLTTVKSLAEECLSIDQTLRRLKARSDRLKARTNHTATKTQNTIAPPAKTVTTANATHSVTTTPTRTPSQEATTERTCPSYSDPAIQALSNQGACFNCRQKGHFSRDCPVKDKTAVIHQVDTGEMQAEAELGKD